MANEPTLPSPESFGLETGDGEDGDGAKASRHVICEHCHSGAVRVTGAGPAVMVWAKFTCSIWLDKTMPDPVKNPQDYPNWDVAIHGASGTVKTVGVLAIEEIDDAYRIERVITPELSIGEEIEKVELLPPGVDPLPVGDTSDEREEGA